MSGPSSTTFGEKSQSCHPPFRGWHPAGRAAASCRGIRCSLASAACVPFPERGTFHRERCIPVRLRQHQYPNRPPHAEEDAQNDCTVLRKRMPPPCPNQGLPDSCPAAVHPRTSALRGFLWGRAGIGRIKDAACFCHIAFPCKLYQFCIGKFFIEFFLRAATQPQSGNVHGNAQVLHRPPKKENRVCRSPAELLHPSGYWAG